MDFEDLRMIDLVEKFEAAISVVHETGNLSGFTGASGLLQNIYDFYVAAGSDFKAVEEYLKNLFSSFNYAAVIINDAMKKKSLDKEGNELLFECLQIMLKCCRLICESLKSKGAD